MRGRYLYMRFDAPMMSFGAPMIDQNGVIHPFPGVSMLTGLFGNALGWHHRDAAKLQALQARIWFGARRDREGELMRDFHTVALGQPHLLDERAWTTHHKLQTRAGGSSKGTHIRYRDYWAGAAYTLAVTLRPGDGPSVEELAEALQRPKRPLFIGRKTCLPAAPMFVGVAEHDDVRQALASAPLAGGAEDAAVLAAWWSVLDVGDQDRAHYQLVSDRRDWTNQVHTGQRWLAHAMIQVKEAA